MRTLQHFAAVLAVVFTVIWVMPAAAAEKWQGVDDTVVGKLATESGHPPRKPYINTDQGDLLLFMFLSAGTIGGFIGGYAFRTLFPPKGKAADGPTHDAPHV